MTLCSPGWPRPWHLPQSPECWNYRLYHDFWNKYNFSFLKKNLLLFSCACTLWWTHGIKGQLGGVRSPFLPLRRFREPNSGHQVHITVPDLLSQAADSVFPLYIFLNFLKLYLFVYNWKVNKCYKLEIKHILTAWNNCLSHNNSKHCLVNFTFNKKRTMTHCPTVNFFAFSIARIWSNRRKVQNVTESMDNKGLSTAPSREKPLLRTCCVSFAMHNGDY